MINTVSGSHVVVVVLGGGGVKHIYTYRHFSRYLHMYVGTQYHIYNLLTLSVPVSNGGERRDRKEKENRKGGLSYSYFIPTLTSLFRKFGGGSAPTYQKVRGLKPLYPPPLAAPAMSTLSGYVVADVSHVAMFSNFDGTCVSDNLRLGPSAGLEV